ncbi:MAG: hypothetical protein V1750_00305 [Acidobacteriota bacterium]
MNEIAPLLATFAMLVGIGWIVKLVTTNRRLDRLAKMHSDMQARILDKLGSSQEILQYLGSEAGKGLLDAPVAERPSPYTRILGSVQVGIVLALGGGVLLALRGVVGIDDDAFGFLGVVALGLGVGFLVSGYAAHALSKGYGLINGARRGGE